MRTNIRRKFRSTSGETIAETLVTMIILSLAVLMLAGAVVTAARINKKADNTDTAFVTGREVGGTGTSSPSVTISDNQAAGTDASVTVPVRVYQTEKNENKNYTYYEMYKAN